ATPKPIVSSSSANQILQINIGNDTIPDKKAGDTARSGKLGITITPKEGEGHIKNDLLTDNALFIVDEVIRSKDYVMALNPDDIASMQVLKGESAEQYGEKGKNGVVRIYLKKDGETARAAKRLNLSVTNDKKIQLRDVHDSITIVADSISFNGDYGQFSSRDSIRVDASQRPNQSRAIALKIRENALAQLNNEPVYVIDGIRQEKGVNINKVDPNTIESISILKDAKAVELYGSEGANGVILINTKSDAKGKNSIHRDTIRLQLKPAQNH
ncbi:MAG TPA: TonB-dependent receptor plug domain-containing protein, partial [Flavitalea sp.]|nr:TonB-dependent receptor plug domain-containing protein [Flavitalea sp.]